MTGKGPVLPSFIRTYVPMGVGAVVGWLSSLGLHLDGAETGALTAAVTGVAGAAYYGLVRGLERRWPALSILLGSKQQPTYGGKP